MTPFHNALNKLTITFWGFGLFLSLSTQPLLSQIVTPDTTHNVKPSKLKVKSWTTLDGLPVNYLVDVIQDSSGFLWIASFHGLTRFDGNEFYTYSSSNTPGWVAGDLSSALCITPDNELWFLAGDASGRDLYHFDNSNIQPKINKVFESRVELFICPNEDIAFAVVDSVLHVFEKGKSQRLFLPELSDRSSITQFYLASRNDTSIIAVGSGLYFLIDETLRKIDYASAIPQENLDSLRLKQMAVSANMKQVLLLKGNFIILIAEDKIELVDTISEGENTYMATVFSAPGSSIWVNEKDSLVRILADGIKSQKYKFPTGLHGLRTAFEVNNTIYAKWWISWQENAFMRLDKSGEWIDFGLGHFSVKQIQNVEVDREGITWIATDHGLVEVLPRKMDVLTPSEGLLDNMVFALGIGQNDEIWASVWGDGIQSFRGDKWVNYDQGNGLASNYVSSFFKDINGDFWAGTSLGLQRFDYQGNTSLAQFLSFGGRERYLRDIYRDRKGRMWIAFDDIYQLANASYKEISAPGNSFIRSFFETVEGALIVAKSDGVFQFNEDTEEWTHEGWEAFSGVHTQSFYESSDSTLWIATYGHGLVRKKGEEHFYFTHLQGLPSNIIHYVLEDDYGYMWLGTDNGLIRVSLQMLQDVYNEKRNVLEYTHFNEEDGMPSSELIGGSNSAVKDKEGNLWFATLGGIAIVNPGEILFNQMRPITRIDSIQYQAKTISIQDDVELDYVQDNLLRFQFGTTSLQSSKRRLYKYRLNGLEDDWHIGIPNFATYTSLEPGPYTFEVFGSNGDGYWSIDPARFQFRILPPFYKTWWFSVFWVSCLLGILWFAYWQIRLRNKLELAEARIQIADDLHDDIGSQILSISQSLDFLKSKDFLTGVEMEELRRQSDRANDLGDELKDTVWMVDASSDSLGDLIHRMQEFLEQFGGRVKYHIILPNIIPPLKLNPKWRRNIYLVYKEALQNAIKHSDASHVTLRVEVNHNFFSFLLSDNGVGLMNSGKKGRGMYTMEKRIRDLNGSISFRENKSGGTQVVVCARMT